MNEVEIVVTGEDRTGNFFNHLRGSIRKWGKDVGKDVNRSVGKVGADSRGSFFKSLFTPNPELITNLTRPLSGAISGAMSTPIGAAVGVAVGGAITTALLGTVGPLLTAGLGGVFLAAGAFALRENAKLKSKLETTGKMLSDGLARAAKPLVGPFIKSLDMVGKGLMQLMGPLNSMFKQLAPSITPLAAAFVKLAQNAMPGLLAAMPGINTAFKALAEVLPGIGTSLGLFLSMISKNQKAITLTIKGLMYFATGLIYVSGVILAGFSSAMVAMYNAVVNAGRGFSHLLATVRAKVSAVLATVRAIPGRIRSALGNLGSLLVGAGRAVIQGLISGIQAMAGQLMATARSIAATVANVIRSALHIGSPSKVTEEIGHNIVQGLAKGMADAKAALKPVSLGVAGATLPQARPAAAPVSKLARGAPQTVVLEFHGGGGDLDRLFFDWIRKGVRTRGGNVQIALGGARH